MFRYAECLRRILSSGKALRIFFDLYREFSFVGIKNEDTDLAELNPAPPPGHPERHLWEPSDPELGPIGLVLSTVFKMGAALDIDTLRISPSRRG